MVLRPIAGLAPEVRIRGFFGLSKARLHCRAAATGWRWSIVRAGIITWQGCGEKTNRPRVTVRKTLAAFSQ